MTRENGMGQHPTERNRTQVRDTFPSALCHVRSIRGNTVARQSPRLPILYPNHSEMVSAGGVVNTFFPLHLLFGSYTPLKGKKLKMFSHEGGPPKPASFALTRRFFRPICRGAKNVARTLPFFCSPQAPIFLRRYADWIQKN